MEMNKGEAVLQPVIIRGKRRKEPSDDVTLIVDGSAYGGWQQIRITRGLERVPNDFELRMTERYQQEVLQVKPGSACEVKIGDDMVITGYVDRVIPAISPRQHIVTVVGRGKCQDLVDCSAIWPGGQIVGSTVLEIAKKLAAPYGIEVSGVGDMGGPIPQHNLMLGETAWEVIERWCRIRQLLTFELPDGNLRLMHAGTQTGLANPFPLTATGFQEGVNVQQAVANWSADQRYSVYRVHMLSFDMLQDVGEGGNLIGTFRDTGVRRFRQRDIVAEQASGLGMQNGIARGQWEASRRFGRSGVVQLVTDSWRDREGALYAPGTSVPIDIPSIHKTNAGSTEPWVLTEVTYEKGEDGTRCTVQAMHRAALAPPPTLPPVLIPAEISNLPDGIGRR